MTPCVIVRTFEIDGLYYGRLSDLRTNYVVWFLTTEHSVQPEWEYKQGSEKFNELETAYLSQMGRGGVC